MPQAHIPTIPELEAFVACARHGTTTLAAARLNLSQSAVSRSIAMLEDRLGVLLFDRIRRRLVLSDAGRLLLGKAEAILAELGNASASVIAFGGGRKVVRLAVLPSFGRSWLIGRLGRFAAEHPDIDLDISARLTQVDFDAERFDLAIMRTEHEAPGTRTEPILEEELVTVVAPDLLDRAGNSVDILSLPLLQQSTRPALWLDWFRATGLDPRRARPGARFEHFDMVIAAASGGLGVGIVPEILAREAIERGRLRLLTPQRVPTGEVYSLIVPERSEREEVTAFCDWLRREIASQPSAVW